MYDALATLTCCGALSNFVKSHGILSALCVFLISIGLVATIGALVMMVPLWMDSEERNESGELGGLAYCGARLEMVRVVL